MKLRLLFVLILIGNPSFSYAQNEVDSLRQLIKSQPNDSNKVNTYLYFFYTDLYYENPEEVIQFAKKAAVLSNAIDFAKGESDAYNTMGYMYRIRSENDSALFYFKKGAKVAEEIDYLSGMADAHTGLGNTYCQVGDWQKAIPHFETVINAAQKAGNNILIASANNNIGNIYLSKGAYIKALEHYQKGVDLGNPSIKETSLINIGLVHQQLEDYTKARKYLEEAVALCKKSGNQYALAFVYQHLGSIEQQSGNYHLAIDYFNEATQIFTDINERYNVSDIKTNLGNLYFDRANYQKALSEYRGSIAIQESIDHYVGICNNLLGIGKVLLAEKKYEPAEDTLLLANQMADTLELLPAKIAVAERLSDLYKSKGDLSRALSYYESYKVLSDSLTNLEKSELVAEMEAKYEISQKEQKIELLSAENQVANLQLQKQQNLRNYMLILAIVLALLVAVGYSRYQLKVKANQKLKELDTLKTNFFTNISHEFRTPLTLILSPLEKVLRKHTDDETMQDLQVVQRNANRLLELINQLLDLSKLEAGKLTLQVREGKLRELLEIIAASFESLAESKEIDFKITIQDLPDKAYYDEDKLYKILNNLLSNAFKFTPSGGKVLLSVHSTKGKLVVSIQDSGPGLSSEQQLQIFERFHQNEQTAKVGGTGVGLTLTRELVMLHGGTIAVDSKPDKGSTFKFTLPLTRQAYKQSAFYETTASEIKVKNVSHQIPRKEPSPTETSLPIALVVEDNADLRNHISSLLQGGYFVHQAQNGKEGIEKAINLIPDIIISDLMMPEVDGMELCRQLKADERTSHIPIIMLTAKADQPSKLDGLKTGADDYLTKPFDADELNIRAKNLIDQRIKLRDKYSVTLMIAPSKIEVTSPDELFIKKALSIVDEHISDPEFTVENFQKAIGMSRMQLHRKLKALTNHSASEFIRDLRLQRAADLLAVHGTTVADAAYSCGFNSLSYFAQCFKEKYGVTPSQYESASLIPRS
ncbi:hypothetical protein C9994_07140 [Marivirga lumbricoides]|uniref:histidine kinase n=1 Tax=Marivirga lumbricoides TaxID=1046115 RepID=A0A2T4DRM7_9BACT|nr:hypothetical protein C9994_07140 [Marivirga lumbricoides]